MEVGRIQCVGRDFDNDAFCHRARLVPCELDMPIAIACVAAFVGLLVALALYLFAYQGFRNKYQEIDKSFAKLAAAAAFWRCIFPS
jgi:hypothetical protein